MRFTIKTSNIPLGIKGSVLWINPTAAPGTVFMAGKLDVPLGAPGPQPGITELKFSAVPDNPSQLVDAGPFNLTWTIERGD